MVKLLLNFIFIFFLLCSCGSEQTTEKVSAPTDTPLLATEPNVAAYSVVAFLSDSTNQASGFGYNIMMDGHTFIHQPSIPSIQGNKGFHSIQQAEKTANFVIYKLTHNMMPPSVTPKELDSLGVLYN